MMIIMDKKMKKGSRMTEMLKKDDGIERGLKEGRVWEGGGGL